MFQDDLAILLGGPVASSFQGRIPNVSTLYTFTRGSGWMEASGFMMQSLQTDHLQCRAIIRNLGPVLEPSISGEVETKDYPSSSYHVIGCETARNGWVPGFDLNGGMVDVEFVVQSLGHLKQETVINFHPWPHQVDSQRMLGSAHTPDVQIMHFRHPFQFCQVLFDFPNLDSLGHAV